MIEWTPWLVLVALGAFHGLNPAMGWLFAVGLGMQDRQRSSVLRAFSPIALGHALAIAVVLLAVALAGTLFPTETVALIGGLALILFGLYKLVRRKHPRWVGMRVGFRQLTGWSFLMASAHGAGLMLVPVLLELGGDRGAHTHEGHMMQAGLGAGTVPDILAVGVHTLAMFAVMAFVALIVYDRIGLAILRKGWFNTDVIWAGALIAAGVVTVAL